MPSREQPFLPFPEESNEELLPPAPAVVKSPEIKVPEVKQSWGPSHIEANDECGSCGKLFASEGSCQYCANNWQKKEYLKNKKK